MQHILYDMGNLLLKEKIHFLSGQYKFLERDGEWERGVILGRTKCLDVFHFSDHLEQFGRLFFHIFCVEKIII